MKRILGHVVSTVAIALVASAAAPACVTNDQSIFIRNVVAPPQNRTNGCLYTDDPSQPGLFEGTLDLTLRDNYVAVLLVGNQMIPRGDPAQTRAESNRVHLNGAEVRVTLANGEELGNFTSTASGFADPQANNVADFGLVRVTLIDTPTKNQIVARDAKLVVANVKVFGQTLGGVDVESGEFQFSVRACNGCLIAPDKNGGACDQPLDDSSTANQACNFGQDEAIPCQLLLPAP